VSDVRRAQPLQRAPALLDLRTSRLPHLRPDLLQWLRWRDLQLLRAPLRHLWQREVLAVRRLLELRSAELPPRDVRWAACVVQDVRTAIRVLRFMRRLPAV
jgi:hypothetical protein